jgi:hypothetical protein
MIYASDEMYEIEPAENYHEHPVGFDHVIYRLSDTDDLTYVDEKRTYLLHVCTIVIN